MPSFHEDHANTRHVNTNLYIGGYAQAATTLSSAIDSPWHRLQARELKYCCHHSISRGAKTAREGSHALFSSRLRQHLSCSHKLHIGGYAQAATTLSSAIDSKSHRLQARARVLMSSLDLMRCEDRKGGVAYPLLLGRRQHLLCSHKTVYRRLRTSCYDTQRRDR